MELAGSNAEPGDTTVHRLRLRSLKTARKETIEQSAKVSLIKNASVRIPQPPQYAPGRQTDVEPPCDAIEADHAGARHDAEIELLIKIDRNAAPDDEAAKPDRRQDHGVDDRQDGRRGDGDGSSGESAEPQRRHRRDHGGHRHRAALPGGAREAQNRKSDDAERKGIERREQAFMELDTELPGRKPEHRVVGGRKCKFPDVFLAQTYVHLRRRREPGQIERILVEDHNGGIALLGAAALHVAVAHDEKRAVAPLYDLAVFGHDGDALVGAARVVDENALKLVLAAPLANVKYQPAVNRREGARTDDVRNHISPYLGNLNGHPSLQPGGQKGRNIGNKDRDDDA